MTYTPNKSPTARRLSFLFILTGFILAALSSILPYSSVFQLIAFLMLVAGVQLLVRYVLTDYRYILDDLDCGTSDLIVLKRQGKKEIKVCHVSTSCIECMKKSGEITEKADKRYNYVQNLSAETYSVIFRDGDKTVEVILECSAEFSAAVQERTGGGGGGTTFAM